MEKQLYPVNGLGMININSCYHKIATDFYKYYYNLWDSNPLLIKDLYNNQNNQNNQTKITYMGYVFNNFNSLIYYLRSIKIYKFDHLSTCVTSQPIDDNTILINVTGTIAVNSIFFEKYSETILLNRNIWNNYYITNSMFSLIEY
jgi:hypothetical protein